MGDNMKRFLQSQSNIEADRIMEQVNQDPSLDGVHAPEELHDALFAQIDAYEKEKAKSTLSEEDKELIKLGKLFKKRRKQRRNIAAAVVAICLIGTTGITAMGGPERLLEKVNWMLAGRMQTNVDSDSERVEQTYDADEAEVLAQIKEEFGFEPVRMFYQPQEMKLTKSEIFEEIQFIILFYEGADEQIVTCVMQPNYRIGSLGDDVEDVLVRSEIIYVGDVSIETNKYYVEERDIYSWHIWFEFQDVSYTINVTDVEDEEVYQIIDNLYFPS